MTTLVSAGGPSEVINARRTESLDAPAILKLVQPSTEQLFGRVNVVNLIEKAVLAVTLSNDHDEVLGHAAFFDYPNVEGVDSAKWESWLQEHYDTKKCNALNTLFMHYFVAKPEYSHGCAREIVRTVFNAVPDLHYCYLVVPTGVFPDSALSEIFSQMDKLAGVKGPDNGVVFACHRHEHVPVLHIREARVQDHDDLVPIFNRQSDMLKNAYGEYFLAELIEAQDDQMKCLVAEVEGSAVGFMSVSTDVNLDLLNECFELGPFHGLRVPHDSDETSALKTPSPPPVEVAVERPSSAKSDASVQSRGSVASRKSTSSTPGSKLGSEKSKPQSSASRSSSRTSAKGEEPRVKAKLSDAQMGSTSSLLSDTSDVESVKSMASGRDMQVNSSKQPPETQATGDMDTVTPLPITPATKIPKRFVPKYYGRSRALCIQLFCIDERFEMRSTDFLPKVYELFNEHEFIVITVPHLVPEFPLLQQFVRCKRRRLGIPRDELRSGIAPELQLTDTVRVTPRCPSTLSQELYVFSKAGLLKGFVVRAACSGDMAGVEQLVTSLELNTNLLGDLSQFNKARRDQDGTEIQAYVAECNTQVVGVAILRREEDIEYIRSHYNVEDFIYYNHHARSEHGHLHHYALNPVFKHYSKHFLKELLRLGHKTCLYYPLYPPYADKQSLSRHTLVAALQDMVPVRSRRQIQYPKDQLGRNAPSDRVLQTQPMYALNHLNRKLTLEPKVTINARIVVVGASDVGVALLETFSFCPHLRFNNLTLVSPHGLPGGELPADATRDQMLGSTHCYSHADYAQMALRAWVNCVYGKMTGIDRKKKHVVVNGQTVVPYDHLIIATGTQYAYPAPTEADINAGTTNSEVPNTPDRRLQTVPPKNLFVVNDQYEAAVALYWIENNLLSSTGSAIVYGHSLDSYCCVQTLLSMGMPGDRIHMVQPPLLYQTSCFNNSSVESSVLSSLKSLGVTVHTDYLLAQWNDGEDSADGKITSAAFTSNTKPLRLECAAFFSYYKKMVDNDAFIALNDACLVFDGRLVIDANFHTNDVSIRGAGSLTKFQRCYHSDQWSHANFNSKEVGLSLASTMLSLFDPTLEPEPEPPKDLLKLIPMYRSPKIHAAVLPGGYHYLQVSKPNLNTPLDVLMSQNDYGRELITGKAEDNYFRLHINQYNAVETITCLSKTEFPSDNLICLFGLHERYLNNLLSRYDEGLITDFYSCFCESWALAIFHDRFPDFRDEVRELLITRPSADTVALEEKVRELIEEDLTLSKNHRKSLSDAYTEGGFKRAVETRLLSFLTYNYYHLPMYAKPGMI